MAKIGYARVSSNTQDYQGQVDALKAAGCERIYSEKMSGKSTSGRRQFEKLMKELLPGDTVVVAKLDRLARSSRDLHNIIFELDSLDCGFLSLGDSWCDTTTSTGRLMLTIMGGIAEFERKLIRQRCDEGIARAKAELATAQWRLERTELRALADGTINNLTVRVGDTARAEVPLIGVVDAAAWRIVANYKQDYLRYFRVGGTAWVWLDSHPWQLHRARITGVARAINREQTASELLPYVAPTTDWIRLQRRSRYR